MPAVSDANIQMNASLKLHWSPLEKTKQCPSCGKPMDQCCSISDWQKQLLDNTTDIFKGSKRQRDAGPVLTQLHAKIRKLTLENDFLESALIKAGLLSAKP